VPHVVTKVPEGDLTLPELYNTVKSLDQVTDVDYFMPGCAPTPTQIMNVVTAIVSGKLPPKGSYVGVGPKTVCDECPREKGDLKFTKFQRFATGQPDPKKCLMEQGYLCVGMATRGGCEARCQKGGVGCRGCYGPPDGVMDHGAKALSAIASMMDAKTDEEVQAIIADLPDVVRSFNRYGLAKALLGRKSI
jgi:F420-non-reducing hydrogenase small subunit